MITEIKLNLKRLFYKDFDDNIMLWRKINRVGRLAMARTFSKCLSEVIKENYE